MTDWASGGGVKIDRAKEHISNLKTAIEAHLTPDRYGVVFEVDQQARKIHYYARVVEEPDPRFGAIAGDALHNLRSALDIMWRTVCHPGAQAATETEGFLIFENSYEFERRFPLERLPKKVKLKSAVKLLHEIKPYKGGNDLLWMLHEADAMDKHRLLIPAAGVVVYTTFEFSGLGNAIGLTVPPQRISLRQVGGGFKPIKNGTYLRSESIDAPTTHVDVKTEDTVQIAFGEGEAIKGKSMIPTLNQITGVVEGVVESFRVAGLIK